MTSYSLADLQKTLSPHVHLGKTRLETLCLLVLGIISARTVNLTHIATERPVAPREKRAKVGDGLRGGISWRCLGSRPIDFRHLA